MFRERDSAKLHRTGQMVSDRKDRLTEAQGLGLQGYYESALEMLEELLRENPSDLESLRMKGNLLELKALEIRETGRQKLTTSADYLTARKCYEKILEVNPRDAGAHIDLGDHYRNLDANDKALDHYKEAESALQRISVGTAWKEDVVQLLDGVVQLTKHDRLEQEARSVEAWCRQALKTSA